MNGIGILTQPLLAYGAAAAGLLLCLALFIGVKLQVRAGERGARQREARAAAALEEMRAAVAAVRSDLEALDRQTQLMLPPPFPRGGVNLSTRSQVLRMHRHGETPDHIAAVLQIPRGEVDLLLKVQNILIGQLEATR